MTFQPNTQMQPPPDHLRKSDPILYRWLQELWNRTWQVWFPDYRHRSIDTDEGVQGGGELADGLTIRLDVNGLDEDFAPNTTADYLPIYETSSGIHQKVKLNTLVPSSLVVRAGIVSMVWTDPVTQEPVSAPWVIAGASAIVATIGNQGSGGDPTLTEPFVYINNIVDGESFNIVMVGAGADGARYDVSWIATETIVAYEPGAGGAWVFSDAANADQAMLIWD